MDTNWTLTNYSQASLWGLWAIQLRVLIDSSDPGLGPGPEVAGVHQENHVLISALSNEQNSEKEHTLSFPGPFKHPHSWILSHCFSWSFENNDTLHYKVLYTHVIPIHPGNNCDYHRGNSISQMRKQEALRVWIIFIRWHTSKWWCQDPNSGLL